MKQNSRTSAFMASIALAVALVGQAGSAMAAPVYSISISNDGDPFQVFNDPEFLQVIEADGVILGGFTQRSARTEIHDGGNPSDLVLTNFRIRADVANAATTKELIGSGYQLPNPAGVAWHQITGSVTLLGPIGAFARIQVFGFLDGFFTGSIDLTVTKNEDREQFAFAASSTPVTFDPGLPAPHIRDVLYIFSIGGGALPGSEIRFPASGYNPFAVPEPSSMVMVSLGFLGVVYASRRRAVRRVDA